MYRQLTQLILTAEIGPKECRYHSDKCRRSPSHVLDLKQCQKVIIFDTFPGRVGDPVKYFWSRVFSLSVTHTRCSQLVCETTTLVYDTFRIRNSSLILPRTIPGKSNANHRSPPCTCAGGINVFFLVIQ